MKQIKITVRKDGKITIDLNGFEGTACVTELRKLILNLRDLGVSVDVEHEEKKPEYYVTSKNKVIEFEL